MLAILKLKGVISEISTLDGMETQIRESSKIIYCLLNLVLSMRVKVFLRKMNLQTEEERRIAESERKLLDAAKRFHGGKPPETTELSAVLKRS